jgi:hypothetical protein
MKKSSYLLRLALLAVLSVSTLISLTRVAAQTYNSSEQLPINVTFGRL